MKINVTKSSLPLYKEYCEEIKDIWDNYCLTNNGPKHNKLEEEISKYLEVENTTLFVNGHSALEIAIEAFNFPKGSEIITTPFTFVSTTNAIVRNGLKPVFCDINRNNYTIDVTKIESLITKKTVAIVPVHVYGNVCDVEGIEKIAKKHNLKVIYDAAHAFGVKFKGKGISNWGDVSMFSFHATKVFNTIEGGALCYSDKALKAKYNSIKNFGLNGNEDCDFVGCNAKMNEFAASMGLCNLRHIDEYISRRKRVVEHYKSKLSNIHGIVLLKEQEQTISNYAYFPVLFENYKYDRDQIMNNLEKSGVGSRKYFYPCTNEFSSLKMYDFNNTPVAKEIANEILCLPLYPDLSFEEIENICKIILS